MVAVFNVIDLLVPWDDGQAELSRFQNIIEAYFLLWAGCFVVLQSKDAAVLLIHSIWNTGGLDFIISCLVLTKIRVRDQVGKRVYICTKVYTCCIVRINKFHAIFGQRKSRFDHFSTVAPQSLHWILAYLAPASSAVAIKNTAIFSVRLHPFALLYEETCALGLCGECSGTRLLHMIMLNDIHTSKQRCVAPAAHV